MGAVLRAGLRSALALELTLGLGLPTEVAYGYPIGCGTGEEAIAGEDTQGNGLSCRQGVNCLPAILRGAVAAGYGLGIAATGTGEVVVIVVPAVTISSLFGRTG